MIRFFDILLSSLGLIILSPLLLITYVTIRLESKGPGFYRQERVGLHGKPFYIYKFRSMRMGSDRRGLITVGGHDPRVTRCGYILRKLKIDELPQLFNVLKGDMSIVGPRPEVSKYTRLYTPEQARVLEVRPGITDWASIKYVDESELLAKSTDPEKTYIEKVMPDKIRYNMKWINHQCLSEYFHIILATFTHIAR
jgi:lipopolysaccharide/colanic/teichoic acid biosynthesis glycosyltransferase